MSRIEEALKRAGSARAATPGSGPGHVPGSAAGTPVETVPAGVFTDAWTMPEQQAEHPAASAGSNARLASAARPPEPAESTPQRGRADLAGLLGGRRGDGPGQLALFQGFKKEVEEKIIATPSIRPAFVEQYRRLAGGLHHAQVERGIKVVMITSALAGEGKTLTATNLALTFSESYRRSVLLIDADLRRPTLHDLFQLPNLSGLGDGLRAEADQKLTLIEVSSHLTLLTAGRPDPDPMHGLTSSRMKRVLEEASASYDWVIIDTPPVGLLPDADLLAGMVDTTLLVIRAGVTPYPLVQRAAATIGRDRILGVVLNQTEDGIAGSYGYYSYYDAYGKK